jgi:hypothetical protein
MTTYECNQVVVSLIADRPNAIRFNRSSSSKLSLYFGFIASLKLIKNFLIVINATCGRIMETVMKMWLS